MPIYEYVCEECDNHLEIIQKITEEPLTTCPECKGRLKKMISSTSFVLKGTGWYATDYASKKGSPPKTSVHSGKKESAKPASETVPSAKETAASGK